MTDGGAGFRRWGRRALFAGLWVTAGYYFFLGGEYSVPELRELTAERDRIAARVDSLRRVADSLERRATRLEQEPVAVERVARERYGFIRDGERLYRFVDVPDSRGGDGGTPLDDSGTQR